jgi:outer membrane beta-barrel protein
MKSLAIALLLTLVPFAAFAQDEEFPDEAPAKKQPTQQPAEEKPVVDPLAVKQDQAPAAAQNTGDGPFARIADEEETIYAVQRKAYLVRQKIELTPMFAATFSDRFVQTFAPAVSATYHVAENFGLELFGSYMFPAESDLTTEILDKGKLTPEIAKLTQMLWSAGLGVQWSPIYGKVQIFGSSLGNFSFYLGAGAGLGQTRVQCTPGLELDPNRGFPVNEEGKALCPMIDVETQGVNARVFEPSRLQFMGSFSGGVRFYFSSSIGLKFEIKDYVFATRVYRPGTNEPTQRFTDAIRNNIFAQLGVSFLFGGEE